MSGPEVTLQACPHDRDLAVEVNRPEILSAALKYQKTQIVIVALCLKVGAVKATKSKIRKHISRA